MKFIPIVIIFVLAALFIAIIPNIFGGFETQHNMTVSNYTEEYEAVSTITQTDMIIIGVVGTILVLAGLFLLARSFMR